MTSLTKRSHNQVSDLCHQYSHKRGAKNNQDGSGPLNKLYSESQENFIIRKRKERKYKLRQSYPSISDEKFEKIWEQSEKKRDMDILKKKIKQSTNKLEKVKTKKNESDKNGDDSSGLIERMEELNLRISTLTSEKETKIDEKIKNKSDKNKKDVHQNMEIK